MNRKTFVELMKEYRQFGTSPRRRLEILKEASALAEASGDLVQKLEVATTYNEWKEKYDR